MSTYTHFDPTNPPPPLMAGEAGSFANYTMRVRIPNILQGVIEKNRAIYPPQIIEAMELLLAEIQTNQEVQPLQTIGPDGPDWAAAWQAWRGRRWLDIPWYFAESFCYRRLLEAANYFGGHGETLAGWTGHDPFLPDKEEELGQATPWDILTAALDGPGQEPEAVVRRLIHHGVWGNRVDLSYMQVAEKAGRAIAVDQERENLLVDDTEAILSHLREARERRVDFICDNAGTELLQDLALAEALLRLDWAGQVVFQVKAHPTFVSDATPADIDMTLAALSKQPGARLPELAARLEAERRQRRWVIRADLFWNSSHFFWELPAALRAELAGARLVIIKGDANYRRLLGDSRWPTTVPLADAVPYFPAPFVALRTLKSEPIVGLRPGQAETLSREDPDWRINGKRGLIQALI